MAFPKLLINRNKLLNNARKMKEFLSLHGVDFHLVTKAFSADPRLVEVLLEAGIENFADSRIINLKRLRPLAKSVLLTRIPQLSEVADVVEYADISLNSSKRVLEALNEAAGKANKKHGVIIMLELGDLREGFPLERLPYDLPEIMELENLEIMGLGANFNCYGGVIPDQDTMLSLKNLQEDLEFDYERKLPLVSGGNSGSLHLLTSGQMPSAINHLRIGEAYLLGRETSYGERFLDLAEDVFTLQAEIVEVYEKNSVPTGEIGLNAAGEKPEFKNEGKIKRAIVALGGQDAIPENLVSQMPGVNYLGNSQDHTIFKLSGVAETLEVGDLINFKLDYVNLVRCFTSEYVTKELDS
ncbi:MAG: alanine racemase [Eubacteriales bacterium]|nr:alanine racemase [Eubacteriales bacterium]